MILEDGMGSGKKAKVDIDNRLSVSSRSETIQHFVSHEEENAYQILTTVPIVAGEITALHMKNTSNDKDITITYIRHQMIASTGTFPSTPTNSNYFRLGFGRKYSSGGSLVTPAGSNGNEYIIVNVNEGSGNTAEIVAYANNPTLTGTLKEIDRWYTKANGDMNTFNKEGSVIIKPGNTMEAGYVSSDVTGSLYVRISFLMKSITG